MSNLAANDPPLLVQFLVLALILTPGLIVFWWTRSYRRSSVIGPLRVPETADLWPVSVAVFIGFSGWLGSAIVYSIVMTARTGGMTQPRSEADIMASMSPVDFVVLAAGTPLLGLAAGVLFLLTIRPASLAWLGFTPGLLGKGILLGFVAAVFGVPFTILAGAVTEAVYQAIDFQHPPEHELLKFMKDAPELWIQVAAIAAAVAIAPLVEEFLFRGLIQTSLMTWFHRIGRPRPEMNPQWFPGRQGFPMMPAGVEPIPQEHQLDVEPDPGAQPPAWGGDVGAVQPPTGPAAQAIPPAPSVWLPPPPMPYALPGVPTPPAAPDASARRRIWPGWLAIVITSTLFAVIHPLWTAPIIFVLSAVIGYIYERTGNLWAAVTLHALFNTTSTVFYLLNVGQA